MATHLGGFSARVSYVSIIRQHIIPITKAILTNISTTSLARLMVIICLKEYTMQKYRPIAMANITNADNGIVVVFMN